MSDMRPIDKEIHLQEQNLHSAWDALLSHEAGRLVLWSILDKAGIAKVGSSMFLHFGTDQDALLRGRQQVGAEILDDYVHAIRPEAYFDMLKEADIRNDALRIAEALTETEGDDEE